MDWCINVSDSSLNCILSQCRSLEALDIGCCEEVTDAAFQGLCTNGFELGLKVLKVSNCPKITVVGIGLPFGHMQLYRIPRCEQNQISCYDDKRLTTPESSEKMQRAIPLGTCWISTIVTSDK
ncbi:RNI-like superfamily protein [Actinidia rufa]|uniref:RNI-like superfamily protein n=1 Tax=Actinidia rufa TaxID=165716 RepID=A0A7J0DPF6_9ERIC|nr:RNI-like superfamily protein [Actinidia rufa]